MRFTMMRCFTLLLLLFLAAPLGAQDAEVPQISGRPAVFLDCQGGGCNQTEIRTEITWVNWVRDAADSDVHVIVTSQATGGGGRQFLLDFIGRGAYATYLSQSTFQSGSTDTDREETDGVTYTLALGLAGFANASGFRNIVTIEAVEGQGTVVPDGLVSAQEVVDPWNLWTFRASLGGNFDGQSTRRGYMMNSSFNASRTTPTWKTSNTLSWSIDNDERRTKNSETDEWNEWQRVDYRITASTNTTVVYSIAEHWSVGIRGGVARSETQNQRFRFQARPAVEYSYFPYEESTRRALTFFYEIGPVYRQYFEETVLGKMKDLRIDHELSIGFSQRQPWGNASISVAASSLLPDTEYHNLSVSGSLSYRLTRGINLNLSGNASRVKDQIYLANRGLTPEEELLRLRTAGTDYTYRGSLSLSYQFGSIFNNVVNNRFPGGGGGGGGAGGGGVGGGGGGGGGGGFN